MPKARARIPIYVEGPDGRPLAGASVYVRTDPGGADATIYTGRTGGATLPNPQTSGADGRVPGYLDRDDYAATVTRPLMDPYVEAFEAVPGKDGSADDLWLPDDVVQARHISDAAQAAIGAATRLETEDIGALGLRAGIIRGGAITRLNANIARVAAGAAWVPNGAGLFRRVSWGQADVNVPNAGAGLNRVDVIQVDAAGNIERVAGVENAFATLDAPQWAEAPHADAIRLGNVRINATNGLVDASANTLRDRRLSVRPVEFVFGRGLAWPGNKVGGGMMDIPGYRFRVELGGLPVEVELIGNTQTSVGPQASRYRIALDSNAAVADERDVLTYFAARPYVVHLKWDLSNGVGAGNHEFVAQNQHIQHTAGGSCNPLDSGRMIVREVPELGSL